jgi:hypothetical protein
VSVFQTIDGPLPDETINWAAGRVQVELGFESTQPFQFGGAGYEQERNLLIGNDASGTDSGAKGIEPAALKIGHLYQVHESEPPWREDILRDHRVEQPLFSCRT